MSTSPQIVTAEDYIKSVIARANSVLVEINKLKIQENKLTQELNIFKSQLAIKTAILDYTKKVDDMVQTLSTQVTGVLGFFENPAGQMITPAHMDLPPAESTLQNILNNSKRVAGRLYQCMKNIDYTIKLMASTAHTLATALGAVASENSTSAPGFLSYTNEPNNGLYNKMKNGVTAGMAALQKLSNTYLGFIQFIHMVEGLYHETQYIDSELKSELSKLDQFDNRNQVRISTESQYADKLNDLILKTTNQLNTVKTQLSAAQVDHNLLVAEFNAANSSINPQKKVAASSVKSS